MAIKTLAFFGGYDIIVTDDGDIAHLVERYVRNVQVTCSSHAISTKRKDCRYRQSTGA